MEVNIAHLYPDLMNIYGDRGNLISLVKRCKWRDIKVSVTELGIGDKIPAGTYDLFFMGGGQDREQFLVCNDLCEIKGKRIKNEIEDGAAALTICGGYQLFGRFYRPFGADELPGIGVFDAYTVAGDTRYIGNVVIESDLNGRNHSIVGFENHSGKTYLGEKTKPLGKVSVGRGNNGEDGYEGALSGGAIGTYLHGSILPKNPVLTDFLIEKALQRKYGEVELAQIDNRIEDMAHAEAVRRAKH